MRKLILSLCVVTASGAYVTGTALTRDGGLQALVDRLTFRPSSPPALTGLDQLPLAEDALASSPLPDAAPRLPDVIVSTAGASVLQPPEAAALPAAPVSGAPPLPPLTSLAPPPAEPPPSDRVPPPAAQLSERAPAPAAELPSQPGLHDGTYTGSLADAYFGMVQVRAHVTGGKVTSVEVLTYPKSRRTSQRINDYALPILEREVLTVQAAKVDIISGATLTAVAYMRSLEAALGQAL